MSQHTIAHDVYKWQQLKDRPSTWVRATYGPELFYSRFGAMCEGNGDVVAWTQISSSASRFDSAALKSRVYDAWMSTRFHLPLIAGRVEHGLLPDHPAHLSCFVYEAVKDEARLHEWARKTLFVTEVEDLEDFRATVEEKRWALTSRSTDSAHPTTVHVILNKNTDPEGKYRHGFFINSPHHFADVSATLTLGTVFMGYLAKADLPSRVWGTEIENLPPPAVDALKMNRPLNDEAIALSCLLPVLEGHESLALKPQKPSITGPTGATQTVSRVLSTELSSDIYKALKSRGFTVSHGVDSARQAACWSLRNMDAKREGLKLEEGYITNLLLPIDCTRQFAEPWRSKPYFCSATAAFTTEIDLKDLESIEDPTSFEGQMEAFDILLPIIAEQWKVADPKISILGVEKILSMLRIDQPEFVKLLRISLYPAIGRLERVLPRSYDFDGKVIKDDAQSKCQREAQLEVVDWLITPRITSSQVCLHTYSWYDKVHLLATYTNNYTREFVDTYLGLIENILRQFANSHTARE